MRDALMLVLACLGGGGLGAIFFGGLWWTVQRGLSAGRPALWLLGSMLLRMATVLVGFYLIANGQWQRLMACLVGFIVARVVVTRLTRPSAAPPREARHAP